jgi:hypothetical protein
LLTFDVFFTQFFNIVFWIVRHFQSEGKFLGRGKKRKNWRYLTIENHVRYKHCIDSDIKVRISKVLSRYKKKNISNGNKIFMYFSFTTETHRLGKLYILLGIILSHFFDKLGNFL